MKPTALLFAMLLFPACASSTRVIASRDLDCRPGQDIDVTALYENGRTSEQVGQESFVIEVANNSHSELTVTSVRVEPGDRNRVPFETGVDGDEHTLQGGEQHVFRFPFRAPFAADPEISRRPTLSGLENAAELVVTVLLTNGDRYHCRFFVPLENGEAGR